MRAISLVNRLEFNFNGNVLRRALTLGDVDNDGNNELIVGSESGEVVIFKGQERWLSLKDVNFVTCVAVGDILNIKKNCLVIVTGDGWCYIYCCIKQTSSFTDSLETQLDEGVDQVDGQIFTTNDSVDSERSVGTDSCANTSAGKEKNILKRVHMQRIPANSKDILLADIDGNGAIELVLGLTDRVVRSYRWCNTPMEFGFDDDAVTNQGIFENVSGKLVGLNKWECAKQIGSVTLHNSHDGSPSLLIAQPGATFMRIICPDDAVSQSSESGAGNVDSESTQSDSLFVSKIDYQSLGTSRMRNQNISTEILGNLEFKNWQGCDVSVSDDSENSGLDSNSCGSNQKPIKSKEKPYVIATLDGTIMLVQNQNILWSLAVDHQIFAVCKLDVTGNGSDDIIACCWDGQTYILDQNKHSVRFHLNEAVQAFECGYYNLEEDSPPVTCFIYVTFRNKIYLYYDVPLKEIISSKFKPCLMNLKELFVDNFLENDKFDKNCQRELVEYLLYGVKK